MKYAAFDLEISKILPDDCSNLNAERPLGISCAGIRADGAGYQNWYSVNGKESGFSASMTCEDAQKFVNRLIGLTNDGYTIVGFNSLAFDFRTLAEESGMWSECRDLAMNHADIMFQFFCQQGYRVGLEALSLGAGLSGKLEGVNGKQAPNLWAEGKCIQVLDYLEKDVKLTYRLALQLETDQAYRWTSQRGRAMYVPIVGGRLLTVQQSLELPEPDTSWIDNPQERGEFMAWFDTEKLITKGRV